MIEWGRLEIARALRYGTTRPTMAALVIASAFQSIQFAAPHLLAQPEVIALAFVAPRAAWVAAYALAALVMAWRLLDRNTRPAWAWCSNGAMCALWVSTYLAPAVVTGNTATLATPLAILPIGAAWVFMRTQATCRDRAQA